MVFEFHIVLKFSDAWFHSFTVQYFTSESGRKEASPGKTSWEGLVWKQDPLVPPLHLPSPLSSPSPSVAGGIGMGAVVGITS